MTPRLVALTVLTMLAFAANSVLNRAAVGGGLIAALDFAHVRLLSGALTLTGLVLLRRVIRGGTVWPGWPGRATGALSLLTYLFGFSFAYVALDTGVGALILFGTVQITMFAGALLAGETLPRRRYLGAGLAFAGLAALLWPAGGHWAVSPLHAAAMALAGIGWGVYSLVGRGARDPLATAAANFTLGAPLAVVGLLLALFGSHGTLAPTGLILATISGAVTSGLGYALWYAILPALGASRAAAAQLSKFRSSHWSPV
ncbi:MAG: DMT family transporter [Paracoccaceae bacterium]